MTGVQTCALPISIGVIAAIIPWNSQMLLTVTKLAPALAMGNTVVIKSSELAPAVLFEFAKLIEETGIPKGVVNVITGFGDPCGKALTTHNLVEKNIALDDSLISIYEKCDIHYKILWEKRIIRESLSR